MFRGKINIPGILGVSFVFAFLLILAESPNTSAYTATLSITGSNSTDIVPKASGNANTSVTTNEINVITNCRAGYNLTVSAPNDRNLYKDGNSSNNTQGQYLSPVDGSSALNNTSNAWGYSLTANTENGVFSPLPNTSATLRTPSGTASQTDIDDTIPVYYGVSVSSDLAPGQYRMSNNGAIVYQLTMDDSCSGFTVAFNANGGTGTMSSQEIKMGEATKLTANSFTAPALGTSYQNDDGTTIPAVANKLWTFWGWNTKADGTGDWYKDEESVTNLVNDGNIITLYAQWKQATLADMVTATPSGNQKVIDHNLMQDMAPETCWNSDITTAANAPAVTLLDYRGKVTTGDNPEAPEQYTVSKLADNNCWMTKNLNLGRTSGGPNGDGTITLTSDDTDLAADTTFTLPAADVTNYTSTTNLAKVRLTNNSSTTDNGGYYSWAASVANTTSTSTSFATSICPRKWDLPSYTMYTNLKTKAGYNTSNPTTNAPSSFLINGGFTNGDTFYQTSYSHFWTNNSYSETRAYGVRVNNTTISSSSTTGTTYGGNKYYRKNIRCVASSGAVTINYNGNGTTEYPVTGNTASQINVEINSSANIQANGFTRTNWAFNGWNTAADGSGTTITVGTPIASLGLKPGETITLYAQWLPQYTITYVNNCMTYIGVNSSCTQTVSDGIGTQAINLDISGNGSGTLGASDFNSWNITGWKIVGWSTVADNSSYTSIEYTISSTYSVTGQGAGDGITLYAHWVPVYTIQYDGNSADNPNDMGTTNSTTGEKSVKQINVSEGDLVTLLASNFKRSGFSFVGWSTDSDAWSRFTDNDNNNDPVIFGPMEDILLDATMITNYSNYRGIITLYAVWAPVKKDGNNNPVYLQDFTNNDCNALTKADFNNTTGVITPGSVIALTDKRDNEIYAVAKLADGKCWMIENLRLESSGTMGNNINDPTVTNQSLSQGYGGKRDSQSYYNYGFFVGLADPESSNFVATNTTSNSVYTVDNTTSIYDPVNHILEDIGSRDNPGVRIPRYNNENTSSTITNPTFTQDYKNAQSPRNYGKYVDGKIYSYGNYYNSAAATANTYRSSSHSTSICPSGWSLPTSDGTSKDYGKLSSEMGGTGSNQNGTSNFGDIMSNRFRAFPNNFLYAGYFLSSSSSNKGEYGYYSSSEVENSMGIAYNLTLGSARLYPSDSMGRHPGMTIRCVIGT